MKFLIHTGRYPMSTYDVATSYEAACRQLGVKSDFFNWASFCSVFNEQVGLQLSHSMTHRKNFEITHLLNVANPDLPTWWLESTDHIKKIAVTADSPWDWSEYEQRMQFYDLIFVNDKSISDHYNDPKITYLPTAYGSDARQIIVDNPAYHSDICFIGTVYPSRVPFFEAVYQYCKQTDRKFILKGCLDKYVPRDSILWEIGDHEMVDHLDTIRYYSNSKIVINTHRDPTWKPTEYSIHNVLKLDSYSLNPRFYELAMCKTLQMLESTQPEHGKYPNVCPIFTNSDNLVQQIDKFLNAPELRQNYIDTAYETLKEHNYVNRLKVILKKIGIKQSLTEPIFK